MTVSRLVCTLLIAFALAAPAEAAEWFVAPGGTGNGTKSAPFGRIQDALNVAAAGDTVTLASGTYQERIRTVRGGAIGRAITLRATVQGSALVTSKGRVLTVQHPYFVVHGIVIDGQYGLDDTVKVLTSANAFTLRNTQVRRSTKDLIDMDSPADVLIDGCLIHHALNAADGRTDAHGVVASAVQRLTIRNTDIHTFSGDAFQLDPSRAAPGWNDVTLENVRMWLEPLPTATNGFPAGTVPGENGIDTKVGATLPRARLTMRDVTAWGFRGGLIGNMAAFNLKENIHATLDRVTVYDSEIAFRLRGGGTTSLGAWVTVKNALVYGVLTAYRYEDNIQNLHIWNSTVGAGVTRAFQAANSTRVGVNVKNLLTLGPRPVEAVDPSNLAVTQTAFEDASHDNYHLSAASPAIDRGTTIAGVTTDRDEVARPVGPTFDVGAYEWQPPDSYEIVVHTRHAPVVVGAWQVVVDLTAASGARLSHPNGGAPTVEKPRKVPDDYFEVSVPVQAGRDYRIWLRGKADKDSPLNDSVYVQFSGAVDAAGLPVYGIGTASAATIILEDCNGCGLRGWGWQDNGRHRLGPVVRFAETGTRTIRIQTREDGISIDQLVLSPAAFLNASPGALKKDTVILKEVF